MQAFLKFGQILDSFARKLGYLTGWLIMPLIFVIMFDVITRKINFTRLYFSDFTVEYGYSISTILQDLQWHFHAAILMFSFGVGYLANAHVRVDIFREMLSKRKQAWFELIGLSVLALPFLILMIMFSWDMVALSFSQGEGSDSMTGIGMRYIPKSFMLFGFITVLVSVIATMIRLLAYLFGSETPAAAASDQLEIFSEESEALEKARLEAERLLKQDTQI